MIARIWRGSTSAEDAESYLEYLRQTGIKEYKATDGNRGVYVLQKIEKDEAEFILLSLWDSYDAIKEFAGEDFGKAVFYPEDERYLVTKELTVVHYSVIE